MKEKLLEIASKTTPRGLGVMVSKNPELKKALYEITKFLPENAPQSLRIWCVKNGVLSEDKLPKCPVCGKLPAFSTGRFLTYCSRRCSQLDKQKFIKKYGTEHHLKSTEIRQKIEKTVIQRYGVNNISKVTREKARQTMLQRYGADNYTKTQEYKVKTLKTSMSKFGTPHPMLSPEIKSKVISKLTDRYPEIFEKVRENLIERYGTDHPMKVPHIKEKVIEKYKQAVWKRLNKKLQHYGIQPVFDYDRFKTLSVKSRERLEFRCSVCGTLFLDHLDNGNIPVCPSCYGNFSKPEHIIVEFLKNTGLYFETNNRELIQPFELDFYIPQKNLAIEINGVYFHVFEHLIKLRGFTEKQAKFYHRDKWKLAGEKGIKLLQFWDSEVLRKKEIVFSIISSNLGLNSVVYARECEFCKVEEETAFDFFLKNHIDGPPAGGESFCLMFRGEPVACITIGKARFGLDGYEVYRLATKNFVTLAGGISKLVKNVLKVKEINRLFSYVNLRLFDGKSLEKAGFKPVRTTQPDYFYTKDFVNFIPRERFMKSKTGIDENQFVKENGYLKIFGTGHRLYVLEN